MPRITKEATARKMVEALKDEARKQDVDLTGVNGENFNTELDKRFGDGGEARCEHFCDHGWEYSGQFGRIGSDGFDEAQSEVVEAALVLLAQS